jgi:transposase
VVAIHNCHTREKARAFSINLKIKFMHESSKNQQNDGFCFRDDIFLLLATPLLFMARTPNKKKTEDNRKNIILTQNQRIKIIALSTKGLTPPQVAFKMKCTRQTVSNTLQRYKKYHTVQDRPRSGRPHKIPAAVLRKLKDAIINHRIKPRATFQNCKAWLREHHGIMASDSAIYVALHHPLLRGYITPRQADCVRKEQRKEGGTCKKFVKKDKSKTTPPCLL